MTKRPFSGFHSSQHKRRHSVKPFSLQNSAVIPSDNTDGVELPDDIADLCSNYMDDNGTSLPVEDFGLQPRQHDPREKGKIQHLKVKIHALQKDLKRSRRVGSILETDMVRLRRQSQKDLSCLRRAQRALQSREDKVTICEKMINRQQQTFVRLESRLQKDMSSFEQNEIQAVMRHLVDEVELSARAAKFCGAQVDLAWYSIMEQDRLDCTATLDKELREAEDFIAVEKQLYDKQVKSLEVELKATCECLQDEKRAATNLKASFDFLQQDLTCKTEWLTALTAGSMSLVRTQNQITTAVEAERAEWQSSTNQLKELNERLQGEHAKQLDVFQAENAQLQEQLRVSELNETNCQQLLRHAEMNAKTATAQHKKIRREFKTLQDRFKSLQEERTLLQQETAPAPLHVPISANLLKANPARLLTLRNKGFVGKRTRD